MKKSMILTLAALSVFALNSLNPAVAVTAPWSKEHVILAKTGNPVSVGSVKSSVSDLVVPYIFKIGDLSFVAHQNISEDSSPTIVSPEGFQTETRFRKPEVVLAVSPSGKKFTIWTEIFRDSEYQLVSRLISDQFGIVAEAYLDEDSCLVDGYSWSASCLDSLGYSDIFAVAKNDTEIAVSYRIRGRACEVSAKVSFLRDPSDPVLESRTLDTVASAGCNPYETPDLENLHKLLATSDGSIVGYWLDQDQMPKYIFWDGNQWSNPTAISGFTESQELFALDRSTNCITFVSFTGSGQGSLQVIDFSTVTGQVSPPKFEFELGSGQSIYVFSNFGRDEIHIFYGTDWYMLDTNNSFKKTSSFESQIEAVYQSPSGRFLIETHGPQTSIYSSYSRLLWSRESGKLIKHTIPDEMGEEIVPLTFTPNGKLVFISNYGYTSPSDGESGFGDGLSFRTLNLDGVPKLESPGKLTGLAKVGQVVQIVSPTWITFSKLQGDTSVSWLSCKKSVPKLASGVPAGCNLIRNSTGLTYTLTSTDKGKYVTVKLAATNATGTGTTILPSLGPVK